MPDQAVVGICLQESLGPALNTLGGDMGEVLSLIFINFPGTEIKLSMRIADSPIGEQGERAGWFRGEICGQTA
jgi:hypothetical protein